LSRSSFEAPRSDALGGLLVALAALFFGAIVVLGKHALESGITVYALLAIRFGVGAVVPRPRS